MNVMTRKTSFLLALGVAAGSLGLAAPQDPAPRPEGSRDEARDGDVQALIRKLGDDDYAVRKEAFDALEAMGSKARAALEAARESDDPETRWNAALLLDRLADEDAEAGDLGRLRERSGTREVPDDAFAQMREALRRIEEWHRGFLDQDLRERVDRAFRAPFGRIGRIEPFGFRWEPGVALEPNSSFSSTTVRDGVRESISIEVDAEGRVVAEREKDGEKTRIEADSVEALRRDHPEMLEGLSGFGGMRIAIAPQGGRVEAQPRIERPAEPAQDPDPSRPRLGVRIAPVKADVAEHLELEDGVGLEIVEVLDGTLAMEIGLRVRDILIEVNGRAIRTAEDVAEALRSADGAKVTAKVIRKGQEKSLGRREAR